MTLLYQQSRQANIKENIALFSSWIDDWVDQSQSIAHYKQAIKAHLDLNQEKEACELSRQASSIYPKNKTVLTILAECQKSGF
jgi:quinol monooxygenase YgiN